MALQCITELLGSLFHTICKGEEDLADTFGSLPDCLIVDILLRLPFDCLLRCLRVCRQWRALISSSQYFTTLYLSRVRPMLLLQDNFNTTKHGQYVYVFGENDRHNKKQLFRKLHLRRELMINMRWEHLPGLIYSCQGILLFADYSLISTYYVLNPVTQEEVTVQHTLHPGSLCALYFCPLTREFRLLYVPVRGRWCQYLVYIFKTKTWRKTHSSSTFKFLPGAGPPAVVNGALHWITHHDLEKGGSAPPCANGIMAFRIDTEEFSAMPHPGSMCNSKRVHQTMKLFAKDDYLSFCHVLVSEYAVDVWILEDYEKWAWIKRGMDTSNPAVFVNAELLRQYVGRRVRAVIQVMRSDGGTVIGRSTDEQQIVVKGSPPGPLTTFVEVIGIADSNQSIRAEIWSNFGDTLDTYCYNRVCLLANGDYKRLFI